MKKRKTIKTMKTNRVTSFLALLLPSVATLALNGCSVIFGTAGLMADAKKSSPSAQEVSTMKPAAALKLVLKDGSEVAGKYAGRERMSVAEYAMAYSQVREQKPDGILPPALGEKLVVTTATKLFTEFEKKLEGTFEGFEHDRILMMLKGTTVLSSVPLSVITQLAGEESQTLSGETIKWLIRRGEIPVMTAIVVASDSGKVQFAMNNVRRIETPAKKHAALQGFFMGAFINAIIVIAVSEALSDVDFNFNFMGPE